MLAFARQVQGQAFIVEELFTAVSNRQQSIGRDKRPSFAVQSPVLEKESKETPQAKDIRCKERIRVDANCEL